MMKKGRKITPDEVRAAVRVEKEPDLDRLRHGIIMPVHYLINEVQTRLTKALKLETVDERREDKERYEREAAYHFHRWGNAFLRNRWTDTQSLDDETPDALIVSYWLPGVDETHEVVAVVGGRIIPKYYTVTLLVNRLFTINPMDDSVVFHIPEETEPFKLELKEIAVSELVEAPAGVLSDEAQKYTALGLYWTRYLDRGAGALGREGPHEEFHDSTFFSIVERFYEAMRPLVPIEYLDAAVTGADVAEIVFRERVYALDADEDEWVHWLRPTPPSSIGVWNAPISIVQLERTKYRALSLREHKKTEHSAVVGVVELDPEIGATSLEAEGAKTESARTKEWFRTLTPYYPGIEKNANVLYFDPLFEAAYTDARMEDEDDWTKRPSLQRLLAPNAPVDDVNSAIGRALQRAVEKIRTFISEMGQGVSFDDTGDVDVSTDGDAWTLVILLAVRATRIAYPIARRPPGGDLQAGTGEEMVGLHLADLLHLLLRQMKEAANDPKVSIPSGYTWNLVKTYLKNTIIPRYPKEDRRDMFRMLNGIESAEKAPRPERLRFDVPTLEEKQEEARREAELKRQREEEKEEMYRAFKALVDIRLAEKARQEKEELEKEEEEREIREKEAEEVDRMIAESVIDLWRKGNRNPGYIATTAIKTMEQKGKEREPELSITVQAKYRKYGWIVRSVAAELNDAMPTKLLSVLTDAETAGHVGERDPPSRGSATIIYDRKQGIIRLHYLRFLYYPTWTLPYLGFGPDDEGFFQPEFIGFSSVGYNESDDLPGILGASRLEWEKNDRTVGDYLYPLVVDDGPGTIVMTLFVADVKQKDSILIMKMVLRAQGLDRRNGTVIWTLVTDSKNIEVTIGVAIGSIRTVDMETYGRIHTILVHSHTYERVTESRRRQ